MIELRVHPDNFERVSNDQRVLDLAKEDTVRLIQDEHMPLVDEDGNLVAWFIPAEQLSDMRIPVRCA